VILFVFSDKKHKQRTKATIWRESCVLPAEYSVMARMGVLPVGLFVSGEAFGWKECRAAIRNAPAMDDLRKTSRVERIVRSILRFWIFCFHDIMLIVNSKS